MSKGIRLLVSAIEKSVHGTKKNNFPVLHTTVLVDEFDNMISVFCRLIQVWGCPKDS